MSRSLRSLTEDEIESLVSEHFGVGVVFGAFLPRLIEAAPLAAQPGTPPTTLAGTPYTAPPAINARVTDDQGKRYVFTAEYPSRTMTAEYADWVSLAQEAAYTRGLPVARQLRALRPVRSGTQPSGFVSVAQVDGEDMVVRLQRYLPGAQVVRANLPADYPRQVGRLAGRVAKALGAVPQAPDVTVHPWAFEATGQNVLLASERLQRWEASGLVPVDVGSMLTHVLAYARQVGEAFESRVVPVLPSLPRQVLHQGINDLNVLVDGGVISGLLDFGACRVAARLSEPAIAAAYALTLVKKGSRVGPREIIGHVAHAYQAETRGTPQYLSMTELELVEVAAVARLCLGACTWVARVLTARSEEPEHVYGQARLERTWPVIEALVGGWASDRIG